MVNGIECCTLAYGFKGEVIEHEYFGTEKVVQDLKKMEGWNEGFVTLKEKQFIRDK